MRVLALLYHRFLDPHCRIRSEYHCFPVGQTFMPAWPTAFACRLINTAHFGMETGKNLDHS